MQKIREVQSEQLLVERAIEGGYELITVPMPAMIAVEKSINEPRFPTMMGTMKAHKKTIPTWSAADIGAEGDKIGLDGSCTQVMRVFAPERKGQGEMLAGETENEVCLLLMEKLQEAKIV